MNKLSILGFVSLLSACSSSTMAFHTIEPRATASIVKVRVESTAYQPGVASKDQDATYNGGINLDVFRAKVMSQTGIRFVTSREDATIQISFGNNTYHAILYYFDNHWEQYYTMRITENSGRIIYVTDGILVGQNEGEQALEMNRLFVSQVIPALQGKSVALKLSGPRVASL